MKKTIISIIFLLALLILILFIFQKGFNRNIIQQSNNQVEEEILPVLEIKEQYDGAKYTFAGTVDAPTPCYKLETDVVQISDNLYEIQINTVAPSEDVMCAQVITPLSYLVNFEANSDIEVTAKINDQKYELSRFVIPEGEDINLFELFIKG